MGRKERRAALGTSTRDPAVAAMFAELAPDYDRMNALITFHQAPRWRAALVGLALPAGRALDFGSGTGDLAQAILARDEKAHVTAFDLTRPMLSRARSRVLGAAPGALGRAAFVQGDGERVPFRSGSFDVVVSAFVMRNIGSRADAYREIARALRPGGRFLQLELSRPRNRLVRALYLLYFRRVMPRLARLASGKTEAYRYLAESLDRWPGDEAVAAEIRAAGFEAVRVVPLTFGSVAIHLATKSSRA